MFLLFRCANVELQRVAFPFANQFIAVVSAQSTIAFERELHPGLLRNNNNNNID